MTGRSTQKFSQKYTIVALLEPKTVGDEFTASEWPQHITLADVFAVDWHSSRGKISKISENKNSFEIKIIDETYFGEDKDVHVLILEKTVEIVKLHEEIMDALEDDGVIFNTPEYTHKGFVPHTTIRDTTTLKPGDTVKIENLSIIDMFPDEDPYRRRIIALYQLKGIANG